MKSIVACLVGTLALSGVAHAQTSSSNEPSTGYVMVVGQSAFGNVTSQSFGAEGGVTLTPRISVFAEFGRTNDTAPASIGDDAQIIASYLTQTQSNPVAFTVQQPVLFGAGGIRFGMPHSGKIEPYVLGAFGVAQVERDVTFTIGGSDVTETLAKYGVVLGTDLAGTTTKPMMSFGGGITWAVSSVWIIDAGYRFDAIFTDDASTNVNRIGVGIGVRF